ncbi:MAG: hypothetical protein ACK50L_00670 [Bacteroidota bacterium]
MTVCILNEKKVPLKGQTIVLIFGTSILLNIIEIENLNTLLEKYSARKLISKGEQVIVEGEKRDFFYI